MSRLQFEAWYRSQATPKPNRDFVIGLLVIWGAAIFAGVYTHG